MTAGPPPANGSEKADRRDRHERHDIDEWCGVVREVGVILDADSARWPARGVQPTQAEVARPDSTS